MEDPQANLERMYFVEFLHSKGHTMESVQELPESEAKRLITDASTYAAVKVAEVEQRAHLVQELHGIAESE